MKPRILVADDEESLRYMLELHLAREGFEVITVADGGAALKALQAGDIDFALCDLVMPVLDGRAVIAQARAAQISTPIVLMSAHADVDTALEATREGAFDYIAKPFRVEEVLFRIQRGLEKLSLKAEVRRLKDALGEQASFEGIVGDSKKMAAVFRSIRKVADYRTTVLLTGESGTGKELVAKALHFNSCRKDGPFIAVNCGAIPEALLESELFGHARGAFTDARRERKGLFEEANGGTLFLDEIGELPVQLQVKLLRVLQESEIRRVGESTPRQIDARVVAATMRDLGEEVAAGRFREDLYYRLNVLPIRLPPLRERPGDITLLVEHFVALFNARLGTQVRGVDAGALKALEQYSWPGNARELENAIERAMVLADEDTLTLADLPQKIRDSQDRIRQTLASGEMSIKKTTRIIEEELIKRALLETGGNRTRAAELLEISHRSLLYKIKEYGLR